MKKLLSFLLIFFPIYISAQIEGTWHGKIEIPETPLTFIIHITKQGEILKITADSPDQEAYGFPIENGAFTNNKLVLSDTAMRMSYEGELVNTTTIQGTFSQNGAAFPLRLTKGDFKLKRPQEPQPPFSYYSEEVTFPNTKANVTLAGTLTLPKKQRGTIPAVILVAGSGPNDRNEEILGHKPFLVIADYLTHYGYAVLRYDKRGVKNSEGSFASSTVFDFASDAQAAFNYLAGRPEINPKKIGIIGHSEGGTVAQFVASENKDLAFIVLMASPGIKGNDLLVLQNDALSQAMNIPEFTRLLNKKLNEKTYGIVMNNTDKTKAVAELKAYYKTTAHFQSLPEEKLDKMTESLYNEQIRQLLLFNPQDYLPKVTIPALVLNGKKDLQVTWKENTEAIANGLHHNKQVTVKTYSELNHMFQHADKGLPDEYGTIEETIAPVVLQDILHWLNKYIKK